MKKTVSFIKLGKLLLVGAILFAAIVFAAGCGSGSNEPSTVTPSPEPAAAQTEKTADAQTAAPTEAPTEEPTPEPTATPEPEPEKHWPFIPSYVETVGPEWIGPDEADQYEVTWCIAREDGNVVLQGWTKDGIFKESILPEKITQAISFQIITWMKPGKQDKSLMVFAHLSEDTAHNGFVYIEDQKGKSIFFEAEEYYHASVAKIKLKNGKQFEYYVGRDSSIESVLLNEGVLEPDGEEIIFADVASPDHEHTPDPEPLEWPYIKPDVEVLINNYYMPSGWCFVDNGDGIVLRRYDADGTMMELSVPEEVLNAKSFKAKHDRHYKCEYFLAFLSDETDRDVLIYFEYYTLGKYLFFEASSCYKYENNMINFSVNESKGKGYVYRWGESYVHVYNFEENAE